VFDDARLDDPDALAAADLELRRLAEAGARVRREVGACAETLASFAGDDLPRAVVAAGAEARLLRAVLEPSCPVPFVAWPGPGLPGWAGGLDTVVVIARSSGDTAATSAVAEATRRGCGLVLAADPHSAIAELAASRHTSLLPTTTGDSMAAAVALLKALHALGLGPDVEAETVAKALDDVAVQCSPFVSVAANPAKELAIALADASPLLWGGSVLAARAARRIAEAMRRATGRTALAADAEHLLPVLDAVAPRDVFADPFDDVPVPVRPVLLVLDDGTDAAQIREERGRLLSAAESAGVRVETLRAEQGSSTARYASLLSHGSYAAAYVGVGLGGPPLSG
jgi:hypothetical protein